MMNCRYSFDFDDTLSIFGKIILCDILNKVRCRPNFEITPQNLFRLGYLYPVLLRVPLNIIQDLCKSYGSTGTMLHGNTNKLMDKSGV